MVTILDEVRTTARLYGIDPDLFEAICRVESSMIPERIRFEKHYKWHESPRVWAERFAMSVDTEAMLQSCSYGLCQVMGGVMRQHGFAGNLLHAIFDYKISLPFGAKHLKSFLNKYGNEADAISAYNQGSNRKTPGGMYQNQTYVDKVHKELLELRKLKT